VQADLDAAITTSREALAAIPVGHPHRATLLSNLGTALQARFGSRGVQADLDAAITVGREAVEAAPDGHPDRARWLSNLEADETAVYEQDFVELWALALDEQHSASILRRRIGTE
jgi:hypothetical protein